MAAPSVEVSEFLLTFSSLQDHFFFLSISHSFCGRCEILTKIALRFCNFLPHGAPWLHCCKRTVRWDGNLVLLHTLLRILGGGCGGDGGGMGRWGSSVPMRCPVTVRWWEEDRSVDACILHMLTKPTMTQENKSSASGSSLASGFDPLQC